MWALNLSISLSFSLFLYEHVSFSLVMGGCAFSRSNTRRGFGGWSLPSHSASQVGAQFPAARHITARRQAVRLPQPKSSKNLDALCHVVESHDRSVDSPSRGMVRERLKQRKAEHGNKLLKRPHDIIYFHLLQCSAKFPKKSIDICTRASPESTHSAAP